MPLERSTARTSATPSGRAADGSAGGHPALRALGEAHGHDGDRGEGDAGHGAERGGGRHVHVTRVGAPEGGGSHPATAQRRRHA